jgi:indolepyruvate ferredoxin oxidoreductase
MEALRLLGLDEAACRAQGIDIYKVGMVWPLAGRDALAFIRGKRELLVVEEKRGIIESQLKEYFYDFPGSKPERMVGKTDETGADLIPWIGELSPRMLAPIVAKRLHAFMPELDLPARATALLPAPGRLIEVPGAARTPYFCSGCPHNTSTRVPEGSKALAGIGCHFMASWMDRETSSLIQMGGEGVNWAASSIFTGRKHVFQNLGEGTWYHSGSMAIRQAIAARANITYKVLYNDAVAMTGGQPVDGPISVQAIAHSARAEGVARIALVSDDPGKFALADFPPGATLHARGDLDAVQRELREIPGVTVLIYEQTCATEKRRRRKRGTLPVAKHVAVINELVCEGCGDCSVASNCLSVEPLETEFGRKRRINQSSCNQDLSCLDGFCPSFVTLEGATRRKAKPSTTDAVAQAARLPEPVLPALDGPRDILITGVGGTGVITVGAVAAMAAHLQGFGASVLDFTGFAQKFGPVLSFLRLAPRPEALNQVRIDLGAADALIGCDLVVSTSPRASTTYRHGTRAVVNTAEMPTGDVVRRRDADLATARRLRTLNGRAGRGQCRGGRCECAGRAAPGRRDLRQHDHARHGVAGRPAAALPRRADAGDRAERRGGGANRLAFALGRLAFAAPETLAPNQAPAAESLEEVIARRAAFLTEYQDAAWAERYRAAIARIRAADPEGRVAGCRRAQPLQADVLQGRVRGRAASIRTPASRRSCARASRADSASPTTSRPISCPPRRTGGAARASAPSAPGCARRCACSHG